MRGYSSRGPLAGLLANKRKLGLMVGLLAVALLLWGRLLLRQAPRTAVADPTAVVAAAATSPTPGGGLTARPVIRVELADTIERDLFTPDVAKYARVNKPSVIEPAGGKSAPVTADEPSQAELAHQASKDLVLQTTMLGETPRAMISGQVLSPGQKIRGFTLKSVMPRHVVLELNGIQIKLEM